MSYPVVKLSYFKAKKPEFHIHKLIILAYKVLRFLIKPIIFALEEGKLVQNLKGFLSSFCIGS